MGGEQIPSGNLPRLNKEKLSSEGAKRKAEVFAHDDCGKQETGAIEGGESVNQLSRFKTEKCWPQPILRESQSMN